MSTKIEWVKNPDGTPGETWNPVSGCTKISDGCKNCYAERHWPRLSAPKQPYEGRAFADVQCHPERLEQPLRWKKPRTIFVNSMSDLFHPKVPFEFIASVFAVMAVTTRHTYLILTKRPERMKEFFDWALDGNEPDSFAADDRISDYRPKHVPWKGYDNCGPVFPYENIWLGVSVEDQPTVNQRIPLLLEIPAANRFISAEPLLKPINLHNAFFKQYETDWVIVGGESGHQARPLKESWALDLKRQCNETKTPFFFKQGSQANWPDYRNQNTYPKELQVKEFPKRLETSKTRYV